MPPCRGTGYATLAHQGPGSAGYSPAKRGLATCLCGKLLFAVLLRMCLACVVSVIASVRGMTAGSVSMMRRFLVMPTLVVFSSLTVVPESF